jgi:hypothetical protein
MKHLAGLKHLEYLDIAMTEVTKNGVAPLRVLLPKLRINVVSRRRLEAASLATNPWPGSGS